MSQRRVLLVVGMVAGGAGAHTRMLAEGLADRGERVTIACPSAVAADYGLDALPVAFEPLEIAARPAPRADSATMRRLRRMIDQADVVHAHGVRAGGMAVLAATPATPVVVTLHNTAPVHGIANRAIFQSLERLVAHRADAVLAVSQDLVQRVADRGARRVRLAVVPARPPVPARRTAAQVRHELGVDGPLVVVVGRLAPQKDLARAIRVATDVADTGACWAVVGEGPLRPELEAQIAAADAPVTLLGRRGDVPDLLGAADVVVSTAEWEGQPVWLQEALQAGAPIVATDVGGTAAVVGDAALLCPPQDRTLADAIRDVLADPALAADLRARSTARARALPAVADALDQVEDVYAEVTGSGPA